MRIIAAATSAVFMHMDAHRPMLSPASASAHIVAAIDAAEHASMHCCIIGMSMPVMPGIGMDFIMSAIMLIAARPPSSLWLTSRPQRRYARRPAGRHGPGSGARPERRSRVSPGRPWSRMDPCLVGHGAARRKDDAMTEETDLGVPPSGSGCVDCDAAEPAGWWVHLRRCAACGHVGCCDSSPEQHATRHFAETGHPVVQSFEPGEDWFWDY